MKAPRTVRVRILVAVDDNEDWSVGRDRDELFLGGMRGQVRFSWIEADAPLPEAAATVAGKVKDDGP